MSSENLLSEREQEILQLVAEGLTNREIAQKLSISHNTVKVHISNIFEKTGVSSRTEATLYAIQERIVDVPGGENSDISTNSVQYNQKISTFWLWGALVFIVVIGLLVIFILNKKDEESQPITALSKTSRWNILAEISEPLTDFASVTYSGQLFIMGGNGTKGVSQNVYKYLPNSDDWVKLQNKPIPVSGADAVIIGNLIFVPGGMMSDGRVYNMMEVYDPNLDLWIDKILLPNPITDYALTEFEGNLYIFGGWDGQSYVSTVWIYNPQTGQWNQEKSMPEALVAPQCFVSGNRVFIYEIESNISGSVVKTNWIYEYSPGIEGGSGGYRIMVNDFPDRENIVGIVSIADNIFVLSHDNKNDQGYLNPIVRNFNNSDWIWLESIAAEDYMDVDVISLGNFIHVMGGIDEDGVTSTEHLSFQAIFSTLIPVIP